MKKSVLFSFFALLLAIFGFGGISMADTGIYEVNLSATIPVSGDKASDMECGIVLESSYYGSYGIESVKYEEAVDTTWSEVIGDTKFQSGHTYRVVFRLEVIESGYVFHSGYFADNIFVNSKYGKLLQYVPDSDYSKVDVYYEFTIKDPEVIDTIGVSGITFPISGDYYSYAYGINAISGVFIPVGYSPIEIYFYTKDGSSWYLMDDDGIFIGGNYYRLDIVVKEKDGFIFSDSLTGTINGEDFDDISISGDERVLSKEFTTMSIIDNISVSNVILPTVGKTVDELGNTPTSLTYGGDYIAESIDYYVRSGNEWSLNSEGTFQKGKKYNVVISLYTAGDFTAFNSSISDSNISINGGTGKLESLGDTYVQISKEVSFVEPTPAPAAAGGGSGRGSAGTPAGTTPSTTVNTNTNAETKAVDKTDDMNLNPSTNELIMTDYLREELENNKELYKNAPLKVFVALYNLKKYDIFSLKQTAEAYNKASEDKKQKLLATLESLNKNDSKRAKYVVDYFKFIAGIN